MTSQRDESVGHRARDETVGYLGGDEMTDDPIVVERHDEVLGGPPADDRTLRDDELASDALVGRHVAPATGSAGLERDPPPLVVPPGPAPGDPGAPSAAATSGAQVAAVPDPEAPVTPGAGPMGAGPAGVSPADTSTLNANPASASTLDAGTPAASAREPAGPNGDVIPAAALAGQQWPAIQAMFVDDPRGSVERAAAAADEVAKAFVASLQREQTALRAAWDKDTSTEDLRTALQQYRAFCGRLEGLA